MIKFRKSIIKKVDESYDWGLFENGGVDISAKTNSYSEDPSKLTIKWNSLYLISFSLLICLGFIFQLTNLQLVNGAENKLRSESNRIEKVRIIAPRGVIYDVNGVQLTNNVPAFRLFADMSEVKDKDVLIENISDLLNIERSEVEERFAEVEVGSQSSTAVFISDLSKDEFLVFNANQDAFPGLYIEEVIKRSYPYASLVSHILGYTGEVKEEDLNEVYSPGDRIGKDGLEWQYEDLLRGVNGQKNLVIDVAGNAVSEDSLTPSVSGNNLKLSIDLEAQMRLSEFLQEGIEKSGATGAAAMVADISTGELLASVSLPSYDNNLFIGGISFDDYAVLTEDSSRPLLNRYITSAQPPGSTFKTITAIAGLDSGTITESTIFNSTGVFYLGSYPFQEYQRNAYGPINVIQALAKSSNIFFYETVLQLGIDGLSDYAKSFGIGQRTGIDLPGEIEGNVSDPEYKSLLTDEIWYPGDSLNAAIGQGYTRVTPAQMLRWVSAIGNRGNLITPHFLKAYQNDSGEWVEMNVESSTLNVSGESLKTVREGMREGVATGIVYTLRDVSIPVAAKTGTAEFGVKDEKGEYTKTHAWVMGFYPYDNPQYVFVFFQEAGGLGSSSGNVAKNFINWHVEYEESL